MARAAQQHLAAMIEPLPQRLVERDDARRDAVDQHIHIDGEARLQFGELEQRLHHQRRIDIFRARFENDAHILGRFVAHVGDQRQLLLHHQLGEPLDQPRFLHAIGYFRDDDDPAAARLLLLVPAGAQPERAAPGAIGFDNVGALVDDNAARRKIRPLDEGEQLLGVGGAMADQIERGVAKLGDIMRRHRGRHADRDALRAIGQQIGQRRRQHDRLFLLAGIIGLEVDRVVVDPLQQQPRDGGHARFGVAIGGGGVAVDIAEIALAVDQRIARRKILREAHQRVVDRLVAMRMERAHHVADDLRAFLERRARVEPQNVHSIENAAMHGLQPVARVGQRPPGDGRERIAQIAVFQRLAQFDRRRGLVLAAAGGARAFLRHRHDPSVAPPAPRADSRAGRAVGCMDIGGAGRKPGGPSRHRARIGLRRREEGGASRAKRFHPEK